MSSINLNQRVKEKSDLKGVQHLIVKNKLVCTPLFAFIANIL